MTLRRRISTFVLRLAISLTVVVGAVGNASAQQFLRLQRDSVPMLRGFAVSADLLGLAQLGISDYGQIEGALRINLHDQYFPIAEVGIGRANHENDEVTGLTYKTSAPYFRIGCDVNLMKNKHTPNRIYGGIRYGYTSYKVDINRAPYVDPVWLTPTSYNVAGEACYQHWAELLLGIDAKVAGPIHLGWSVRYRRRIAHDDGITGNTWYVPGFGRQGGTRLGGTFCLSIDI